MTTTEEIRNRLTTLSKESVKEIYVATIGYDPFEDDPTNTLEDVVKVLQEYMEEDALEIPDSVWEREGF